METDFYDYTIQELAEEKDRCFLTGSWCPNQLCEQCDDYINWSKWCEKRIAEKKRNTDSAPTV